MGLANVAYFDPLTWADTTQHVLETQSLLPLLGTQPVEMGMAGKEKDLASQIAADPCYRKMFLAAFPDTSGSIDMGSVTKSLATFERTLISYGSPYDRFRRGDRNALSQSARHGAQLFFGDLNCSICHAGINFTDSKFHHIGLYNTDGYGAYPPSDPGLREITGLKTDDGAIRTPSLRNVALTGPYMHDGSVASLADAIRRHLGGSTASPSRDAALPKVTINDRDVGDLVAFLGSLSDLSFIASPRFATPRTACGKRL